MGETMIRKIVLFLLLFSCMMAADENFPFIGLAVGYQKLQPTQVESSNHTPIALHFGAQSLKWRTLFALQYASAYKSADIEVDYIPFDAPFGTPILRPYIGLNVNYFRYDHTALIDNDGYSFGANIGLLLYTSDRIDIDLGYHYNKTEQFEGMDTMQGATLSVHYFY